MSTRKLVQIGDVGRFHPLKPGMIHLKCRRCGKTLSNLPRSDYDHPLAAVIVLSYCDRCDRGGEFEDATYYDATGKELSPE